MAQFARPDADVSTGNWSASSGSSLYAMIDESSASDSDYISVTDSDGSAEACTVGLSSVTDPDDTSSHSVVVRAYTDSFYSSVTLNVALKAGSTTIKSQNFTPSTSFSNFTMSLSSSEAGSIGSSGYGDLSLVITATDGMMMMSETRVSQAYFTCPDAPVNVTPSAAACEVSATFLDRSSQSVTPNAATIVTAASVSTIRLGVLKTIGTDVTHGTSTPTSSSGSSTYTVGFDTAVSGVAAGDKVYFDDYSQGSLEEYVYQVETVNSTTSFDLTYVSGGSQGDVTPYGNLYAADFSQAEGVFKRVFDYATPQAWIDDFNDTSIYSAGDYAIGAIGAVEKFDEHLQLNCVQTNHTLGSITLTVLSHARHDGTAGSGAGLRFTSSGSDSSFSQHIYVASSDITIQWLEIDGTGASSVAAAMHFISNAAADVGNVHIRNNLMYGLDQKGGGIPTRAVRLETPSDSVTDTCSILNNILYDIEPSTPSGGDCVGIFASGGRSENSIYVYNNTVHKIVGTATASGTQGYGRGIQGGANTYVKNNIVTDVTSTVTEACYFGTFHSSSDYNLSTDTTASGSNSITSATLANIYESITGSIDLHLKSGSPAINAGEDLGRTPAGVNIDIDGRDRDAEGDTWSIGADQYFVNGIEINPDAATFVADAVDPTVTAGYPSATITPAAAAIEVAAVSPTTKRGSVTITAPVAAIIAAAPNPTVSVGFPSITVTPSVATIIVEATFAGIGFTSVTVSPAAAVCIVEAPTPTTTEDSFSFTPDSAVVIVAGITPTTTESSITKTPAVAAIEVASATSTITLGSIAVTPLASSIAVAAITPTLVFGSTTATPSAAAVELNATYVAVAMSSVSVTPSAATVVAVAITPTVTQGSLSLSATAVIEAAAQSPTATNSSVTVTPIDASVLVESKYGGLIAGNVTVIPNPQARINAAAIDPTVAFGSQVVTPGSSEFVANATFAAVVKGNLNLSPAACIVEISAVSPTIDMGLDIAPPVAAAIYDVGSFTLLVGKLSAYVGYSFSGLIDYDVDGLIDYELSEPIDYQTTTSPIDYSNDGLLDYEYDN
jgi:hypothetical protein